jgi:hypothetical protein
MDEVAADDKGELLAREVYVGGAYKAFGEVTAEDARGLADQLSGLRGGGLEGKVAPVGRAWRDLAELLTDSGATCVAELGPERAAELAEGLRVVPPGGSWLSS